MRYTVRQLGPQCWEVLDSGAAVVHRFTDMMLEYPPENNAQPRWRYIGNAHDRAEEYAYWKSGCFD